MNADSDQVPAPRTPLHFDITFKKMYGREDIQGSLKNLSLSGAFLKVASDNLKVQDKVTLNITLAGRARKLHASVIWVNGAGAGIKFMPTNKRDVQIIDDLIYFVESKRVGSRGVMDQIFKKVS
jgi:hypothetical protein